MGLDLYFIKRPAETTADTTRREQDEAVGYYRKFSTLCSTGLMPTPGRWRTVLMSP